MPARVSVVMVCRDGLPYVLEALGSVLAQTLPDPELLFFDNGSVDGSGDAADALEADVRILRSSEPVPLATARNRLAEAARGRWLAFLDADDAWDPRKLERQLAFTERRGGRWSYTDCRIVGARGEPLGRYSTRTPQRSGGVTACLLLENFIPLSTVMVEREAVLRSGGFDPTFSVASDYDLWLRLSREHEVVACPEVLGSYRIHGTNLTRRYRVAYSENRLLYRRWARSPDDPPGSREVAREALALLSLRWGLREIVEGRKLTRGLKRMRVGLARARSARTAFRFLWRALASSLVRLRMLRERRRAYSPSSQC